MTDKTKEVLRLALEALEWSVEQGGGPECEHESGGAVCFCKENKAITAIREALASKSEALAEESSGTEQPAQKRPQNCGTSYCSCIECVMEPAQQEPVAYAVYHRMGGSKSLHWPEQHSPNGDVNEYQLVPLYTSPPAQQQEPVAWPAGLIERIKAAEQRIQDGHAPRRIPADPTDVDLVLAEVRYLLEGKQPPFWVNTSPPAQRKPWVGLTNKEIEFLCYANLALRQRTATEMAFAVEAKLKEKNA